MNVTEFPDYERGPGFWLLFELLIGADVSLHPNLSAKNSAKLLDDDGDMYEVINESLTIFERSQRYKNLKRW